MSFDEKAIEDTVMRFVQRHYFIYKARMLSLRRGYKKLVKSKGEKAMLVQIGQDMSCQQEVIIQLYFGTL